MNSAFLDNIFIQTDESTTNAMTLFIETKSKYGDLNDLFTKFEYVQKHHPEKSAELRHEVEYAWQDLREWQQKASVAGHARSLMTRGFFVYCPVSII